MMSVQSFSGIVISAGFVLFVAAMVVAPQLYNTADIDQRVAIIAANQARWNLSQLLFALGPGVTAAGFFMLAVSQRSTPAGWLFWLSAALFAAGSVMEMWLVYQQTTDPAGFWEGTQIPSIISYGFLALTLAGMLFFGIAVLRSGFPNWLGYLMAVGAVVFLIGALVTRGSFFVAILVYLATFVAGIVIWRS